MDGPDGVFVHLIAWHPNTEPARVVMRELAKLPLPQRAGDAIDTLKPARADKSTERNSG